jgi:Mor family transcriptional regulator
MNQERDAAIRAKRDAGMTIKALAAEYKLSVPRINQILCI